MIAISSQAILWKGISKNGYGRNRLKYFLLFSLSVLFAFSVFLLFTAGVSVMAMQTRVMNTMVPVAPAKTTQRPPLVSAALRVTGKTATGSRYAHARDHFKYGRISLCKLLT